MVADTMGAKCFIHTVPSGFIRNEFNLDSKLAIGAEFGNGTLFIGEKTLKAQVWDIGKSCERYTSSVPLLLICDRQPTNVNQE